MRGSLKECLRGPPQTSERTPGIGELETEYAYVALIGAFFCPEIRAFTGVGARFRQPFPKSLVTVQYYKSAKMAVNGPLIAVNRR